jgi:flagellar hook-length control protein FliK
MLRGAGGRQIKEMTSLDVNNTLTESNARTESVQSILPRTETAEINPLLPQRAELSVPVRVGSTNWGESIAGRLSLMVNQRISAARIHISPPELGPIEVRVNLNGDQASVQFVSHSAQVRDALEQSIPRLREMLEDAGFTLEDSDVSDQSSGKNSRQQSDSQGEENQELVEQDRRSFNPVSIGLIDQFV